MSECTGHAELTLRCTECALDKAMEEIERYRYAIDANYRATDYLAKEYDALERINKELLTALEGIIGAVNTYKFATSENLSGSRLGNALDAAKTAISKAKETSLE